MNTTQLAAAIRAIRATLPDDHCETVDLDGGVHQIDWRIPHRADGVIIEANLIAIRNRASSLMTCLSDHASSITITTLEECADLATALEMADLPEPEMITVCCVCHRADLDGRWVDGDEATERCSGRPLTHGYCPDCYRAELEKITQDEARRLVAGDGCFGGEPMRCWSDGCTGWDGTWKIEDDRVVVRCECGNTCRHGAKYEDD